MDEPRVCSKESCNFQNSGECELGEDPPSSCPKLTEKGTANKSKREVIGAPDGGAITWSEARTLYNEVNPRTVTLVADQKAGKTTLLSKLYGQFLMEGADRVGGWRFASARTLFAFERRAHHARLACRARKPSTKRTPRSAEGVFLHLKLEGPVFQDFLFLDVSGEFFEELREEPGVPSEFETNSLMLERTDDLLVLLDGEKLHLPSKRAEVIYAARGNIASGIEAGLWPESANLRFVATKWDIVAEQEEENQQGIVDYLNRKIENLKSDFGADFDSVSFHRTQCFGQETPERLGNLLGALGPQNQNQNQVDPDPIEIKPDWVGD